jgi:glycosyltransferase involved in cell wall biosynthesis
LKPLRFLMVCMQYPTAPGQSYMTTELAEALVAAGHEIEVLLLEWHGEAATATVEMTTPAGVRVVRCASREIIGFGRTVRGASKFLLSGRDAAQVARRHFDLARFDAMISWMPSVSIAPLVARARRAGIRHRLLFIWDFFPDHHRQIGRIPGGLPYRIARWWEQKLLAHFTAILCTLPGNADYLRRHYRVSPAQRVSVTPIWSDTSPLPAVDRDVLRGKHGIPIGPPIAVFGGQLVEGRGFGQMLGAAEAGLVAGSPLLYLFVGDGRMAPMLRERAARQPNIRVLPALSRADYLELLGACDVGMAVTVPGVTSFSIPTKTIDYLRAGLPVIAAVEEGNDLVAILNRYGVGRAVPFDEPGIFQQAAEKLATDPAIRAAVRAAAPRCLDAVFDVRHAVAAVIAACE